MKVYGYICYRKAMAEKLIKINQLHNDITTLHKMISLWLEN